MMGISTQLGDSVLLRDVSVIASVLGFDRWQHLVGSGSSVHLYCEREGEGCIALPAGIPSVDQSTKPQHRMR